MEKNPFFSRYNYAWDLLNDCKISSSEYFVYIYILNVLNAKFWESDSIGMSVLGLSARMSVSKNTLLKSLHRLEELSLVEYKPGNREQHVTTIRLLPVPQKCAFSQHEQESGQHIGQRVGQRVGQHIGQRVGQNVATNINNTNSNGKYEQVSLQCNEGSLPRQP